MAFPYTPFTYSDGTLNQVTAARMNASEAGIALAGVTGTSASPPGSPTDGMLWRPSPATGIYWMFQYDSSLATHKWAFVGGSAWEVEVVTDESTTSAAYVDLATVGPSITVPRAGVYIIEHGAEAYVVTTAPAAITTAVKLGAAATSDNEAFTTTPGAVSNAFSGSMVLKRTLAASDVIKQQIKTSAGTAHLRRRWLKITPQQVI